MLILIDLASFDFHKLVRHVFSDMEHYFIFKHMLDHLIIFSFQKL